MLACSFFCAYSAAKRPPCPSYIAKCAHLDNSRVKLQKQEIIIESIEEQEEEPQIGRRVVQCLEHDDRRVLHRVSGALVFSDICFDFNEIVVSGSRFLGRIGWVGVFEIDFPLPVPALALVVAHIESAQCKKNSNARNR